MDTSHQTSHHIRQLRHGPQIPSAHSDLRGLRQVLHGHLQLPEHPAVPQAEVIGALRLLSGNGRVGAEFEEGQAGLEVNFPQNALHTLEHLTKRSETPPPPSLQEYETLLKMLLGAKACLLRNLRHAPMLAAVQRHLDARRLLPGAAVRVPRQPQGPAPHFRDPARCTSESDGRWVEKRTILTGTQQSLCIAKTL